MRSFKEMKLTETGHNQAFARYFNGLLERLDQERIDVTSPLLIEQHATGKLLKLAPRNNPSASTSSGAAAVAPTQFTVGTKTITGSDYPTITPGVVNQATPDPSTVIGYTGTALSGSLTYVWLDVVTDGKTVTSVDWDYAATLPAAPLIDSDNGSAPLEFFILLGYITGGLGSRTVNQIDYGPFVCQPRQILLTPRTSVTSGGESYDRWWTWLVKGYN